jgi:hypothetical protein
MRNKMNIDLKLKEELLKGDFRNENEDDYVKKIEADTKRNRIIKISMGAFYITLLIVSLFVI